MPSSLSGFCEEPGGAGSCFFGTENWALVLDNEASVLVINPCATNPQMQWLTLKAAKSKEWSVGTENWKGEERA